jgi:hypothetical protein
MCGLEDDVNFYDYDDETTEQTPEQDDDPTYVETIMWKGWKVDIRFENNDEENDDGWDEDYVYDINSESTDDEIPF